MKASAADWTALIGAVTALVTAICSGLVALRSSGRAAKVEQQLQDHTSQGQRAR